jgi:hypothetical protein
MLFIDYESERTSAPLHFFAITFWNFFGAIRKRGLLSRSKFQILNRFGDNITRRLSKLSGASQGAL